MKYATIAFSQGDDAEEVMDILDKQGERAAIMYLKQNEPHNIKDLDLEENEPWGTNDKLYHFGNYVLSWNYKVPYISLTRLIDYYGESIIMNNKELKEELRTWLNSKLDERYYELHTLQPEQAIEKYGYYLDPANTKFIDGVKHYLAISNNLNGTGYAPVGYESCYRQGVTDFKEASIQQHTDVTDEWKKALGATGKAVKNLVSPERRLAKLQNKVQIKGLKLDKKISSGLANSKIQGLKANKAAVMKSYLPTEESVALPFEYDSDGANLDSIKKNIGAEKLRKKMINLGINSKIKGLKQSYKDQYGLGKI